MPSSGARKPDFKASRMSLVSPEFGFSDPIVSPIDPIVLNKPQNVPNRPRKTSRLIR